MGSQNNCFKGLHVVEKFSRLKEDFEQIVRRAICFMKAYYAPANMMYLIPSILH